MYPDNFDGFSLQELQAWRNQLERDLLMAEEQAMNSGATGDQIDEIKSINTKLIEVQNLLQSN